MLLDTIRITTVFTCLNTVTITTGQSMISNNSTLNIINNIMIIFTTQLSTTQNTMVSLQLLIMYHTMRSITQPFTATSTE